jgi:hypothetical protein
MTFPEGRALVPLKQLESIIIKLDGKIKIMTTNSPEGIANAEGIILSIRDGFLYLGEQKGMPSPAREKCLN